MYNLNSHQNKMNQIRQCPLLASSYLLKSAAKTSKPLRSKSCARPISTDMIQLLWVYNKMTFPTSALLMTSMTDVMAIWWRKWKPPPFIMIVCRYEESQTSALPPSSFLRAAFSWGPCPSRAGQRSLRSLSYCYTKLQHNYNNNNNNNNNNTTQQHNKRTTTQ